jgi:3-oxoacyl-[acyl-carrier protein] reductase
MSSPDHTAAKVAIVTGGARGIGAAVAARLAADGNAVAVVDLEASSCAHTVGEITAKGGRALALGADVSDATAVVTAVDRIAEELGAPTILVNNAGVTKDNLVFKMTDLDWDAVMNVHLRGTFLMTRAVQSHMTETRWGRIVNMSSVAALGNRGQANYSTAKAGLQGLTKTLAIELGPFGITVNAIAPGFIATDMTKATAERIGVPWEEFKRRGAASIPVRRVGEPEDIAALASFLVGEESSFITGQVVYVAGGPRS